MELTDDVVQQLREKAKGLRSVADQLAAGELLGSAVEKARDAAVWTGSPQVAFCGWLDQLDRWVRQLGGGVGRVAEEIERHVGHLDDAQRKVDNAVPGVVCPPPAGWVRWTPVRPPEFVMQVDHSGGAVFMAPTEMEALVTILGRTKDAFFSTGRLLDEALAPPRDVVTMGSGPAAAPLAIGTQVAAQLAPKDHVPPDAAEACGWPVIFPQALGIQLDRALMDVLDRSRKWALAAAADAASASGGLLGGLAGLGAALAKAQATAVPDAGEVSRQHGAADAASFAATALPKAGDCPDHGDLARMVGEVRAKAAGNPAYAAGFTAALGAMHYKEYGVDAGNGFEWFARKVDLCGTGLNTHEQRWGDLQGSVGEVFASATHDPGFDIRLAEHMADSWSGGRYVLSGAPLRTDVALMVADHWIKAKDWRHGKNPADIAAGLGVLAANPEAAHIYALGHAELLSKGTNPHLFHEPGGGGILGESDGAWDEGVATRAADVLRIGLVEYPAQIAAAAAGQGDTPSGQAARAAAEEAQRKAEVAMGAAIDAVSRGAKPGPEGRLALAGFVATHIDAMAKALTSDLDKPELREDDALRAHRAGAQAGLETIAADPAARGVVLAGATQAMADWSADLARRAGAELAQDPTRRVGDVIASQSRFGEVQGPGSRLGAFYGELGNAIMANADDAREAAAQAAGFLGFFVSKVAGGVAGAVGAAVGGGVGGIVAGYGAEALGKAVESYVKHAEKELAKAGDADQIKAKFVELVTRAMEQATAVSLWADDSIRARLLAGDPPDPPVTPPPRQVGGKVIVPPLEDPPGRLRLPAPDDQPAYDAFKAWFENAQPLRGAAAAGLHNSGMLEAFDRTLIAGLMKTK